MRDHDVKRWGPLRAATDGRPRLVRVLALIQELACVDERAVPDAARIVVDRVAGAQLELFMLSIAGDAAAVGQADKLSRVWETGYAFFSEDPQPSDFFYGRAGLLDWMRKFWVVDATLDRDWNEYSGAPLAILESAARALFPEVFGAEASGHEAVASVVPPLPPILRARKPGDEWTPSHRGELLAYCGDRKKADSRLTSEALLDELGITLSCTASNLKQQLAKARKASTGQRQRLKQAA